MTTTADVHTALAYSTLPDAHRLQGQLNRCGHDWLGTFTCGRPACDPCRNRYIGKQRRAAQKRFAGLKNEDLGFVSIVIGATDDLDAIPEMFAGFRKDLRNIVDGMRRGRDSLWVLTEFLLWLEVDAVSGDDFAKQPPEKRAQMGKLAPVVTFQDRPIWVVTVHGIVGHPTLPADRVQARLAQRWSGAGQVHIRPFYDWRTVPENISGIVNYSLKQDYRTSLEGRDDGHFASIEERWPISWIADYHAFLQGWSRGFQSLRISIGRRFLKGSRCGKPVYRSDHSGKDSNDSIATTNTALLPLSITDITAQTGRDFFTRFRALPSIKELEAKHAWVASSSIPIPMSRADDDWLDRATEMKSFAEAGRGRARIKAPMGEDVVTFEFEDDYDAVEFKLRFG